MDGVKPRMRLIRCLLRRIQKNNAAAMPTPAVPPKAIPTMVPVDVLLDDDWPQTELLQTPDAHISPLVQADPSDKTAEHV